MKTYTARVTEQRGPNSRSGTFLFDVEDTAGDAAAMGVASHCLDTENPGIKWGPWEDDSQSTVYIAGVTLETPASPSEKPPHQPVTPTRKKTSRPVTLKTDSVPGGHHAETTHH